MTDIDIDFLDRNAALEHLPHIPASNLVNGKFIRHANGVYVQNIPVDPTTGFAGLTYQEADAAGYFKFDLINNAAYAGVRDEAHLDALRQREPPWHLLDDQEIVEQLPHVRGHFAIVEQIKPTSVADLALVIALIRPGKYKLLQKTRSEMEDEIWQPPTDGAYYYKKSHAIAFALSIVVCLNLLVENAMNE